MEWWPRNHRVVAKTTFSSGFIAGAIGHVVLAVWILAAFVAADTSEERSFGKDSRARAAGLAAGTIGGLLLVAGLTIAIGV